MAATDDSRDGLGREQLDGVDHRDMTKQEALFMIGRKIGMFGHKRQKLTKRDLNSIYWYLTGEQIAPPIDFGTKRSPTVGEMRGLVAQQVGIPYVRDVSDVTGVDGTHYVWCGSDNTRTYDAPHTEPTTKVGGDSARPFRLREIQAIVRALRVADDQRSQTDRT